MNIYQINDFDYIAADTLEEAVKWFLRNTGGKVPVKYVRELDDDDMADEEFVYPDGRTVSFHERLMEVTWEGRYKTVPFYFASKTPTREEHHGT